MNIIKQLHQDIPKPSYSTEEEEEEEGLPLKADDSFLKEQNENTNDERNANAKVSSSSKALRKKSPHIVAGDSLRGIGVIIVVLYHMGYEQFKNAWFGISMFFSLSGFFMTKNTVEAFEKYGYVDVYKFWAKRISRLFPILFLTVIVIVLSQKLPSRHDDGVTFQREAIDLAYATFFATNYNLVYNQVDDYFDEFSNPSITRHLWTLSIEEQYYIIWPLVLLALTKIFGRASPNEKTSVGEGTKRNEDENGLLKNANRDSIVVSESAKRCIWAIFVMDVLVIVFSYFSSLITIEKMGISAAYYSTWCRMGDIASGGFVYSVIRLHPSLERRWFNDPTMPPMTSKEKAIFEICLGCNLLSLVAVPMIQKPVEDMFQYYFGGFRLLISFLTFAMPTSAMLASEPLPRWAIVSKMLSWYPLTFLGTVSYGVYLIHWPLLVYFGDAKGAHRKQVALGLEEPRDEVLNYDVRNFLLFLLVVGICYVSFDFYEKPMLVLSRKTQPSKTIAVGLSAMAVTLTIIWLTTKDLDPMETFENDLDEIFDASFDTRSTPFLVASTIKGVNRMLYLHVLDYNTRTTAVGVTLKYDDILEHYPEYEHNADTFVIVMCKSIADRNPCDDPHVWSKNVYWIWLESEGLCRIPQNPWSQKLSDDFHTPSRSDDIEFQRRCDDVMSISELALEDKDMKMDSLPLLVLAVDEAIPGVLNQNTISKIKEQQLITNEGDSAHESGEERNQKWNPITVTMLGESVALRLGMFWNDIIDIDLPLLTKTNQSLPSLELANLGIAGTECIPYFACLSNHPKYQYETCQNSQTKNQNVVLNSLDKTKPDVVVVRDSHWALPSRFGLATVMDLFSGFEKTLAFNLMLEQVVAVGAEHMFYVTYSATDMLDNAEVTRDTAKYFTELNTFMRVVDTLACSKEDESSIRVTVVDFAKLVCPGIEHLNPCPRKEHGFDDILPDSLHPHGDSGLWLSRESLALVIAEIYRFNLPSQVGMFSSIDEALENPMSKQLLALSPPDGNPALSDIVTGYYLCPYSDLEVLESDYKQAAFRNYSSYRDSVYYVE